MPPRAYIYVGPEDIKARSQREAHCLHVVDRATIVPWMKDFLGLRCVQGEITVTFIIDTEEQLWIADRRSEHVACADKQDVLAAGEMSFAVAGRFVTVDEVSNQSTGYCPEPECWTTIAKVLDRLGLQRPSKLTAAFEFRRCNACGATNIVKDGIFECAICDEGLSSTWNY